jgi:hypothetical protein
MVAENRSYISMPDSQEIHQKGKLMWLGLGDHCLAIRYIGELENVPLNMEGKSHRDRSYLVTAAEPGKLCGFVLEVRSQKEFSCLECFADEAEERSMIDLSKAGTNKQVRYVTMDGDTLEMLYMSSGSFTEATVDWGFGPTEPGILLSEMGFRQPDWPSGEGYGRIPRCSVNGVTVDFEAPWPVFEGPHMNLKGSVMEVGPAGDPYVVDYRGRLPVFSTP